MHGHEDDTRNPKPGELPGHGGQRRELELAERPIVTPKEVRLFGRIFTAVAKKKTRGNFARDFLPRIGAPVTVENLVAMMAWMQAEGDAGRFNPLNTTQKEEGSTDFNWVHVQNYLHYLDGVVATVRTLNYGAKRNMYGYRPIRAALRDGHDAGLVLEAVERSAWGTGGLASRVLEQDGAARLLTDRYLHHRLSQ